jgi:hypothetical protein
MQPSLPPKAYAGRDEFLSSHREHWQLSSSALGPSVFMVVVTVTPFLTFRAWPYFSRKN